MSITKEQATRARTWFIYVLKDPIDGQIRYLGLTCNVEIRFRHHLSRSGDNKAKDAWIGELAEKALEPVLEVIDSFKGDFKTASQREQEHIKRLQSCKTPLFNQCPWHLFGKRKLKYRGKKICYELVEV